MKLESDKKPALPDPGILPLAGRVLVQRLKPQDVTKGGIVIPDSGREKSRRARVIAVGPEAASSGSPLSTGYKIEDHVKAGDVVLMNAYAGAEIQHEGVDYVLVEAADLLAVLTRGA